MVRAEHLLKHFKMISSRLKTFSGIIQSLVLCRGCRFKDMAAEIKSPALLDSKIKSVSRFLGGNHISDKDFFGFMKRFVPQGKVVLSIDRTIWEFGKQIRNVLVLAVSFDKIAMPLLFKIIPYKGASTAQDQIELLAQYLMIFGKETICMVTADREFDNARFINFLASKNIDFAVRLRKITRIKDNDRLIRLDRIMSEELNNFNTTIYGIETKIDHKRIGDSEFLSVASSPNSTNGFSMYRQRWDIECAFKGCKSAGFAMESTNSRSHVKLNSFIKCIFIAFALAIKAGFIANQKKAIPFKKTLGCKAYSLFQYGLRSIKNVLSQSARQSEKLLHRIIEHEYPSMQNFFVR